VQPSSVPRGRPQPGPAGCCDDEVFRLRPETGCLLSGFPQGHPFTAAEQSDDRWRHLLIQPVAAQRPQAPPDRWSGRRPWAGGNDVKVVADDVGENQRDELCRKAASASRPPLTLERCLRTVFSSQMSAPALSRRLVVCCLSARENAVLGSNEQGEPPPEMSVTISVLASAAWISLRSSAVACRPWPSGTGCPAS